MSNCEQHKWIPTGNCFFCTHCGSHTPDGECESCGGDELIHYELRYICSECKCAEFRGTTPEMITFNYLASKLSVKEADPFCEVTQYVQGVLDRIAWHNRKLDWIRSTPPTKDALKTYIERVKTKRN